MTCILVRVRPKDVVHSRLYRPFAREEREDDAREPRKERRRAKEKLWRKRGSPVCTS